MHGVHDLARHFHHEGDVAEQPCACAFLGDALDGASEIEVNEVGVRLLDDTRRLNHGVDETPVYLDGYGAFGVIDGEFFQRFVDRTHESVGGDEFGVEPVGAEFFAKLAEGGIGDILHGREHQGAFAYFNACYVHRSFR